MLLRLHTLSAACMPGFLHWDTLAARRVLTTTVKTTSIMRRGHIT
jgi:hypothetical protein